ncbi:molybdopterin-synthase adenylyltransferase MoeB [Permianibacter sp. IMCC34836]|uniref:HesA/MoeB/ThiF family protein n=1 Tax=Permianibacter fluminis TaxID=2738515 RepID=UPI00155235D2|nr:molybdopterin-synthase adenylyltransferase MoeB [Permianibacter fluminis]NQD36951.1 molybdopterin-synthase adenylyltransferase MoeB [Permianibacter fluminis]
MAEFSDDELLRYSRHILLPQIDITGQQRLRASHVLIVGAGGLGCPVALYLAAAGIGTVTVADGDRVELSNLQRQIGHDSAAIGEFKAVSLRTRMLALDPSVQVNAYTSWLSEDNVSERVRAADVVVDCSDNFATRFLLNTACVRARKPLVSGAAIRGEGQLAVFLNRDGGDDLSPCYACLFPDGVDEGETCAQAGVLSPLVGVIGALQAVEVIKLVVGLRESKPKLTVYDAWQGQWRQLYLQRDPDCRVCAAVHGKAGS